MIITGLEDIEFMIEHRITANQFLLCYLIHTKDLSLLDRYMEICGRFSKKDVDDLIEKNLIKSFNPNAIVTYKPSDYTTTPLFKSILTDTDDAAEEFFKAFPEEGLLTNSRYPARNMPYKLFQIVYMNIIKGTKKRHLEMMGMLKKWKEDNGGYATMGMKNFFETRYYETLLKKFIEDGEKSGTTKHRILS